jgi:hypothetical protein
MSTEPTRYDYARAKFLAGELLVEQAILMLMEDGTFAKHASVSFDDARVGAEKVVRNVWARELIERIVGHELPDELINTQQWRWRKIADKIGGDAR